MDPAMAVEIAAMSRQKVLEDAIAKGNSEVQEFYRGSTVFITGGSGFMGKQMIEKLFRSCKLTKLFVLLRPKKGVEIYERLKLVFEDPVFDHLRKQQPDFEQKIVAVSGDVAEVGLGISDEDWETITNEVDVVIHMAATTRFDEVLRTATLINVRGTREAIALGRACKNLRSFVHVSTAYTYAMASLIKQEVFEKFYPCPVPPQTLIAMAEHVDTERLNALTEGLIQDWPNTYTFTKAVAEELVRTMTDGLPICIVRPGVVVSAYREPLPGWIDISCAYGATGMMVGVGLGVLHTLLNSHDSRVGLVPCDYVNNAIMAAGAVAKNGSGGQDTKIYFVSSNVRNPIIQGRLTQYVYNLRCLASPKAVYYNFSFQTSNKILFLIQTWLLHIIPSYFADFVCLLLGKERQFVKLSKKVYNITSVLSYFWVNDWLFVDKNLEELYNNLSKTDKTIFNFDILDINWEEYVKIWCIGTRKYIVKDGLKDTEAAKRKQQKFKIIHYFVSALYIYCLWKVFSTLYYILYSIFSPLFICGN